MMTSFVHCKLLDTGAGIFYYMKEAWGVGTMMGEGKGLEG